MRRSFLDLTYPAESSMKLWYLYIARRIFMKALFLMVLILSTSIAFAKDKKKTVEDQVAEMVTYLKKFSQIKETYPEKMPGASERTRSNVAAIVNGFGAERIPTLVNFGRLIRATPENGDVELIEFYSFEPLEFNYNGQDFKYKTTEDFLDAVAKLAPKKTVYNLVIEQANAKGAGYLLAGLGGFAVGRSSTKSGTTEVNVTTSTTVQNNVTVNNPDEITIQSRTERERAKRAEAVEAVSNSVAANFPSLTCNSSNEKLVPFSSISYRKENNVTIVKFKPTGILSSLELRQNHIDGSSIATFCENDKSKCVKIPEHEYDSVVGDKLDSPVRKSAVDPERTKIDALMAELIAANDEYRKHGDSNEISARMAFIKQREIKYPKTSTMQDLENMLLTDAAVDRAYEAYLKKEGADSPFSKDGTLNKAGAIVNRMMALSKENFKIAYYRHLNWSGYTKKVGIDRVDSSIFNPTRGIVGEFVAQEIEKLRPFSNDSNQSPSLLLTAADEAEFMKLAPQRVAEVEAQRDVKGARVREVVKKVRDYLGLKPDKAVKGCEGERWIQHSISKKGRKVRDTGYDAYDSSVGDEFKKMTCSLAYRYDYLVKSTQPAQFAELSTEMLEAADCCLDSSCKPKVLKKIRDRKAAKDTQYERVR